MHPGPSAPEPQRVPTYRFSFNWNYQSLLHPSPSRCKRIQTDSLCKHAVTSARANAHTRDGRSPVGQAVGPLRRLLSVSATNGGWPSL